jgi:hypothetical protein
LLKDSDRLVAAEGDRVRDVQLGAESREFPLRVGARVDHAALEFDESGRASAWQIGADDEEVSEAFGEAWLAVGVLVGDCRDEGVGLAKQEPMVDDGGLNFPL